ncbi:MAG: aspartate aminotransferase family protein [Lentisphaeria bacterium]|nr:aspartate aminotransferase family protein [Lentisphaeria bacterium]
MDPLAQSLLEAKRNYMVPCLYHFYRDPPVMDRAAMQYVWDVRGRRYTDFYAGVTVMNCGHCNPEIIEPAIEQIRRLQHTTTIYLNEPIHALARDLVSFLDCGLDRVFFVNSGSEANEGAMLLAKLHTGRRRFVYLRGGLHGRTAQTMAVTGIPMWRTDPTPPECGLEAPCPHCLHCELGLEPGSCGLACAGAVEEILGAHGDIAAVLAEPIQGNGGIVVPPAGYFERVQHAAHRAGALLIFDEVQTGFCRTGAPFAFRGLGVEPDILSLAKALGNGFPIGAFCARAEIAASYTRPGASTTGGNPVSAAAGRAVLRYLRERDLAGRSSELGAYLRGVLERIASASSLVAEVRGRGLMLGMELCREGKPAAAETDRVLEELKDAGYLVGKTGMSRNVVTFLPPLVIAAADIDGLAEALEAALHRAESTPEAP